MYPDPEAQFYTYIGMNNTMKPNQQFRNEGQYGLTTFVNFSFHFGSQDPQPFHSAWDPYWNPNSL
jgi:hypothetical protein